MAFGADCGSSTVLEAFFVTSTSRSAVPGDGGGCAGETPALQVSRAVLWCGRLARTWWAANSKFEIPRMTAIMPPEAS